MKWNVLITAALALALISTAPFVFDRTEVAVLAIGLVLTVWSVGLRGDRP